MAIVRIQATALKDDGTPHTFRKRVVVKENGKIALKDGKPVWDYEQAPVFVEAERCVPSTEGKDPAELGKEVGISVKADLERRLGQRLAQHGLLEGSSGKTITAPVSLNL